MLKIRLSKTNYKKKQIFSIVVINSQKHREGEYIEKIGFYNTKFKKKNINIKRFYYWIKNGAKLTKTLSKIFHEYTKFVGKKKNY